MSGYGFGQMSFRRDSLDEESRSVVAVVATDQPVRMFDFERFDYIDEILVGRGGSFPDSVPLLDSHIRDSVDDVRGGVSQFVLKGGKWSGRAEFDTDEPSERAFGKVKRGYVTDVSVGYEVRKAAPLIDPGKSQRIDGVNYKARDLPLRVSTEWRGKEVSLAAIGADDQAKIRSFARALQGRNGEQGRSNAAPVRSPLALELEEHVQHITRTFDVPVATIHSEMMSASGLSSVEFDLLLSGEIDPTREWLEGMAAALETDVEPLLAAANL